MYLRYFSEVLIESKKYILYLKKMTSIAPDSCQYKNSCSGHPNITGDLDLGVAKTQ